MKVECMFLSAYKSSPQCVVKLSKCIVTVKANCLLCRIKHNLPFYCIYIKYKCKTVKLKKCMQVILLSEENLISLERPQYFLSFKNWVFQKDSEFTKKNILNIKLIPYHILYPKDNNVSIIKFRSWSLLPLGAGGAAGLSTLSKTSQTQKWVIIIYHNIMSNLSCLIARPGVPARSL